VSAGTVTVKWATPVVVDGDDAGGAAGAGVVGSAADSDPDGPGLPGDRGGVGTVVAGIRRCRMLCLHRFG